MRILTSIALVACLPATAVAQALPATIPLEVLDVDPALTTGGIAIGFNQFESAPAIAMQPARIARAIVIESSGGRATVLGLALLGIPEADSRGRAKLDGAHEMQAWCELPSTFKINSWLAFVVDCYQDKDRDGSLETKYKGHLGGDVAVMLSTVDSPEAIKPLPYRPATTPELPRYEVGYGSCGARTEKTVADVKELRYSALVRRAESGNMGPRLCRDVATLLETRADGERIYQFGRFKVAVRENDGALDTRLVEGLAAGTLLGNLRADRPLLDAAAPVPLTGDTAAGGETKPPLYLTSIPQTQGQARAGEIFLTADVALGVTGKLRLDTSQRGWGSKIVFPAGTPVFGTPMGGSQGSRTIDASIVWCAPYRDPKDARAKLIAYCFMPNQFGFELVPNEQPFQVSSLRGGQRAVDPPIVDRGEVDFGGPLKLQLRFVEIKPRFIALDISVATSKESAWTRMPLTRATDGSGQFVVGGAVIALLPGADEKSVSVVVGGEFKVGAPATVLDTAR